MTKECALDCISRLKDWLEKRGYKLYFSHDAFDEIDFEEKTIHLTTRTTFEKRLYSLLHECGHLIEWDNGSNKYFKKYPLAKAMLDDGRKEYSLEGMVQTIEEEINAWKKGFYLAQSLGFPVEHSKYNRYAAQNSITYIDSVAHRKHKYRKIKEEKTS